MSALRIAYADPPYLGCCGLYDHHHPDGRCWDHEDTHERLIERLSDYDGWILHASVPSLTELLPMLSPYDGWRVMAWVKPFAAFKRNVSLAYAWEPVIVSPARRANIGTDSTMRDWIAEPITLKRGFTGAKPAAVVRWALDCIGAEPDDEFDDLFPGSGAVTRAWRAWCGRGEVEQGALL